MTRAGTPARRPRQNRRRFTSRCEHCGRSFAPHVRGKPQRFCRTSCQQTAYRERARDGMLHRCWCGESHHPPRPRKPAIPGLRRSIAYGAPAWRAA